MSRRPRVLVLGAGCAGLETAFLLRRRLEDAVDITVVSAEDSFLFKPSSIYIPFGLDEQKLRIPLVKPLHRRKISFRLGRVAALDPDMRTVGFTDGTRAGYDFLVLATGATMRPDEIPGLADNAATIFTPHEMRHLASRLDVLRERTLDGQETRVVFLVPPGNMCSGPLYEIAFMLETWLRRQEMRDAVDIVFSTYEAGYLQAFGPRLDSLVEGEFIRRGIDGSRGQIVTKVVGDEVAYADGSSRGVDELIAFPPYAPAVTYPALPADDRGFVRTEPATRQVAGFPGIYAPGDTGDFPVKQAYLAVRQADAVAEHIAAQVTGGSFHAGFDPVSMCVMEMFDQATFARVPLETTGDPERPVRVRPDAGTDYRVGTGRTWRLGKKALGIYAPMRFRAGRPFHEGLPWKLMEGGLGVMSRTLAR